MPRATNNGGPREEGDSVRAIAFSTVATEPSRVFTVSALRASVNYRKEEVKWANLKG
jgi:hypothetical protein